jgi:hypothetical protein
LVFHHRKSLIPQKPVARQASSSRAKSREPAK